MSRLIPLWAEFQPNLSENAFLMKQFRRYWQRAGGIGRKKKLLVIFRRSSQVISSNSSKYWKEPDAKTQSQHNKTVVDWLTLRRERRFWVYQAAVSLRPLQTNDDLWEHGGIWEVSPCPFLFTAIRLTLYCQKKPLPANGIFRLWIWTVNTFSYCLHFFCARPRFADGRKRNVSSN